MTRIQRQDTEPKHSLPSPISNTPGKEAMSLSSYAIKLTHVKLPQAEGRKRKRLQEDDYNPLQKAAQVVLPVEDTTREHSSQCQREGDKST
jgi:hypothetical protein